jgi:hypothetical protein
MRPSMFCRAHSSVRPLALAASLSGVSMCTGLRVFTLMGRFYGASSSGRIGVCFRYGVAQECILSMAPLGSQRTPKLVDGRLRCIVCRPVDALVTDVAAHARNENNAPGDPDSVHLLRHSAGSEKRSSSVDIENPTKSLHWVITSIAFPGYGCAAYESPDGMT